MIAKEISRKKATGSFKGLVDYIEDKLQLHKNKVEFLYAENCEFETIEENIKEVHNTQDLYTGKADPNYHLVVSFQEDEKPSQEQLRYITNELLKSIGIEHHQRICATHVDTNNYHIHIAVNRIDPETNKRARLPFSKKKLDKKMVELEEKLGLKRDNHIPNRILAAEHKTKLNTIEETNDGRQYHRNTTKRTITRGQQATASLHKSNTKRHDRRIEAKQLSELRNLSECDMVHNTERTEMLLQGDEPHQLEQERETNTAMRRTRISNNINDGSDEPRVNRQANDIRSHTGILNITEWVKKEAMGELKEVFAKEDTTLKDFHTTLAKYNLEIFERGNGLIIKDKTRNLFCKASDISRDFSKAKLSIRFGEFEAMEIDIKSTTKFGLEKNTLWIDYKDKMNNLKSDKNKELKPFKDVYDMKLADWQKRFDGVKKHKWGNKKLKRETYEKLFEEKKQFVAIYKEQRVPISKKYKQITYKEFLITEALKGNEEALVGLRYAKDEEVQKNDNVIIGKRDNKVFIAYDPTITKRGFAVYKLDKDNDKSKIIDKGNHIKLIKASEHALLKSLEMAKSKYGNTLDIQGDDKFKQDIIQAVYNNKLDITFTDKNMNDILKSLNKSQTKVPIKQNKSIE